jgi:hypothetical protein
MHFIWINLKAFEELLQTSSKHPSWDVLVKKKTKKILFAQLRTQKHNPPSSNLIKSSTSNFTNTDVIKLLIAILFRHKKPKLLKIIHNSLLLYERLIYILQVSTKLTKVYLELKNFVHPKKKILVSVLKIKFFSVFNVFFYYWTWSVLAGAYTCNYYNSTLNWNF